MKIQDILTFEKKNSKKILNKYSNISYYNSNTIQRNYEKKKGYFWVIPSHSEYESILLNNYEKDCVVAYVENKYLITFVIKIGGKDNFKGFVFFKDFLKKIMCGYSVYTINKVYDNKDIIKAFDEDEENLKVIDNTEYQRFIKLGIIESLE